MKIICNDQYQVFADYMNSGKRTRSAMQKVAKELGVPVSQIQHMTECMGHMVEALERQVSPLASDMNAQPINGSMGFVQCPLCYKNPAIFDSVQSVHLDKKDGFIPITCCIGNQVTIGGTNREFEVWDENTGYKPGAKCRYIANEPYVVRMNPYASQITDPVTSSAWGYAGEASDSSKHMSPALAPSNVYKTQVDTVVDPETGEQQQLEEKVNVVNKSQTKTTDKSSVGGSGRFNEIGNAIMVYIDCQYTEKQTAESGQTDDMYIPIDRDVLNYMQAFQSDDENLDTYEDALFDKTHPSIERSVEDYMRRYTDDIVANRPVTGYDTMPLSEVEPLFRQYDMIEQLEKFVRNISSITHQRINPNMRIPVQSNILSVLKHGDKMVSSDDVVTVLINTISAKMYGRPVSAVNKKLSELTGIFDDNFINDSRFQKALQRYSEWYTTQSSNPYDDLTPDAMLNSLSNQSKNLYLFGDTPVGKYRQSTLRRIVSQQINQNPTSAFDELWLQLPPSIKTLFNPEAFKKIAQTDTPQDRERIVKVNNLFKQLIKEYSGENPPALSIAKNKLQSLAINFLIDDVVEAIEDNDPNADLSDVHIGANTIRSDRDLLQTAVNKYLGINAQSALSKVLGKEPQTLSTEDVVKKLVYRRPDRNVPGKYDYYSVSQTEQPTKTKKKETPQEVADQATQEVADIDAFHGNAYDKSTPAIDARLKYIKQQFFSSASDIFDAIQKQYVAHKSRGTYKTDYDALLPQVASHLQGIVDDILKSTSVDKINLLIDKLQFMADVIIPNEDRTAIQEYVTSGRREKAKQQINQVIHKIGIDTPSMASAWISFIHNTPVPGETPDGKHVSIATWLQHMNREIRTGDRVNIVKDAQSDQLDIRRLIGTDSQYDEFKKSNNLPIYKVFTAMGGAQALDLYRALQLPDEQSVYSDDAIGVLDAIYSDANADNIGDYISQFEKVSNITISDSDKQAIQQLIQQDTSVRADLDDNSVNNIAELLPQEWDDNTKDKFFSDLQSLHRADDNERQDQILSLCQSYNVAAPIAKQVWAIVNAHNEYNRPSAETKTSIENVLTGYYQPSDMVKSLVNDLNRINIQYSVSPKLRHKLMTETLAKYGVEDSDTVLSIMDNAPQVDVKLNDAQRQQLEDTYQQLADVVAESTAPVSAKIIQTINNGPSDQDLGIQDKLDKLSSSPKDMALYLWGAPETAIPSLAPSSIEVVVNDDGTKEFFDPEWSDISNSYAKAIKEVVVNKYPDMIDDDEDAILERYNEAILGNKSHYDIAAMRWNNAFSSYKRTADVLAPKDASWDTAARYAQDNIDTTISMKISQADPKHVQMLNEFVNTSENSDQYKNIYTQVYEQVHPIVRALVLSNVQNARMKPYRDDIIADATSEVMDYLRKPQTVDANGNKLSKFRGSGSLKSYLFRICQNKIIDQIRKRGYTEYEYSERVSTSVGGGISDELSLLDNFGVGQKQYDIIDNTDIMNSLFKSITTQLNTNPTRALPALFAMMSQGDYSQIAYSLGVDPEQMRKQNPEEYDKYISNLRSVVSDVFARIGASTALSGNILENAGIYYPNRATGVDDAKKYEKVTVVKLEPGTLVDVKMPQGDPARLYDRRGNETNQYADTTIKIPGCEVVSVDMDKEAVQVRIPSKTVYVDENGAPVGHGIFKCPQHNVQLTQTNSQMYQVCPECKKIGQVITDVNGQWKANKPNKPEYAGLVQVSIAVPQDAIQKQVPNINPESIGPSQYTSDYSRVDQTKGVPLSRDRSMEFAQKVLDEQGGVFEVPIHYLTYAGTNQQVQPQQSEQSQQLDPIQQYVDGLNSGADDNVLADIAAKGLSQINENSPEYTQLYEKVMPFIKKYIDDGDKKSVIKIINHLPVLGDAAADYEDELESGSLTNREQEPKQEPEQSLTNREQEQSLTNRDDRLTAPVSEMTGVDKDIEEFKKLLADHVFTNNPSNKMTIKAIAQSLDKNKIKPFLDYTKNAMKDRAKQEYEGGNITEEQYNTYTEQLDQNFDMLSKVVG